MLVPDGPVGPRRAFIKSAILGVKADGGTNIGEGLRLGYAEAQTRSIPEDAVRVVLLLSDGRASAGITSSDALVAVARIFLLGAPELLREAGVFVLRSLPAPSGDIMAKAKSALKAPEVSSAALGPDQLLTRLPALEAIHRKAFTNQFTEAACLALGTATKSAAVRAGALAWAGEAQPAVTNAAIADEIDYAPERLTWVVELIVRLDAVRGESGQKGALQSTTWTTRDVSRDKAKALRQRLMRKLRRVVAGDEIASRALADTAAVATDQELTDALNAIASVVDTVTASSDPEVRILATMARVTAADAEEARAAASASASTKDTVALGGRSVGDRDTPAVNQVEGRLLKELLFLRDAFDDARQRGVAVPALIAPPGLRQVLARSHPKKAAKKAPSVSDVTP